MNQEVRRFHVKPPVSLSDLAGDAGGCVLGRTLAPCEQSRHLRSEHRFPLAFGGSPCKYLTARAFHVKRTGQHRAASQCWRGTAADIQDAQEIEDLSDKSSDQRLLSVHSRPGAGYDFR